MSIDRAYIESATENMRNQIKRLQADLAVLDAAAGDDECSAYGAYIARYHNNYYPQRPLMPHVVQILEVERMAVDIEENFKDPLAMNIVRQIESALEY